MPEEQSIEVHCFFDFLKAVAILGVYFFHVLEWNLEIASTSSAEVISHGVLKYFLFNAQSLPDYVSGILRTLSSFGNTGVEFFIIASGFGLYLSYLSKKNTWLTFYKKRVLRIIPLYYLFLLATYFTMAYLVGNTFYSSPQGLKILVEHFLLIQTFTDSYKVYGLFYFAAIIFHLYLVFPFLTKIMQFRKWHWPFMGFAFLLAVLPSEIFAFLHIDFKGLLFTDYLLYFFLGVLIADSVFHNRKLHGILLSPRVSFIALVLLSALIFIVSYLSDYNSGFGIMIKLLAFLSVPFLFSIVSKAPLRALINVISYSSFVAYLSHLLIARVLFWILAAKIGWTGCYDHITYISGVLFPVILVTAFLTQKTYDTLLKRLGFSGQSRIVS